MENSTIKHMAAAKRILMYVKVTLDLKGVGKINFEELRQRLGMCKVQKGIMLC